MNTARYAVASALRLLLLCAFAFGVPFVARAQDTASEETSEATVVPGDLTRAEVRDLVSRLSDEQVRQILIDRLEQSAPAAAPPEELKGEALIDRFIGALNNAERGIADMAAAAGNVTQVPVRIWHGVAEGSDAAPWSVVLTIGIIFAVAVIAEKLFRRAVTNVAQLQPPSSAPALATRVRLSIIRALVELLCIIVFMFAILVAWALLELPTDNAQHLFTALLTGVLVWRLLAVLSRMVLAPRTPAVRPVELDDTTARRAHSRLMLLAGVVIFFHWCTREVLASFGFDMETARAVGLITSGTFFGLVIAMIWQLRPTRGRAPVEAGFQDYLGRIWHIVAILGTLLIYVLAWSVHLATGAATLMPAIASLIVLGFVSILDIGLRGAVDRFMGSHESERQTGAGAPPAEAQTGADTGAIEAHPATTGAEDVAMGTKSTASPRSYSAVVVSNGRILLFLFALVVFGAIWDLNLLGLLQALFGERATSVIVNFSVTALLAYAVWGIVSTAVERAAGPVSAAVTPGEEGGGEGSRLGTVLPLFKKFVLVTLIVMLVLILLSSLGVNIGPLIAGAGIVGIAIGFGAQTLVRDIVSGLFFLLDDAFRVGEYVTIGDIKGTVEKISVRSLRLRHHNGPLHTVPFGEIQTLTNWSRDWAIMKFEIRVPFETDIEKVRKIIKKVGIRMLDDPELGPMFLQPLKSQGVNRMDDSSLIIRCKFTSKPGDQWYLRRHAFARIQEAFEEQGIKFAPRRVIVETASPGVPPEAAAAAAAAVQNGEQQPNQAEDKAG